MAAAYCSFEVFVTLTQGGRPMLRYKVWNSGGDDPGTVVVDPFAVVAVHETIGRNSSREESPIAVIQLHTGREVIVCDEGRKVAADIWLGKSIIN